MGYFKYVENGYIIGIQTATDSIGNISKDEYEAIENAINEIPKAIEGYEFKLKEDLSIEIVKLEEVD